MKGIVLCGGNSTRMGSDKGLLKEEEETWAEIAARKLAALNLPVFVSVNRKQVPTYSQIFPGEQLITDHPGFEKGAPLFGLLSTHLQLPGNDLFVLACDMKDMQPRLMQDLHTSFQTAPTEACVYHTGLRPQPLCGIYSADGLQKIHNLYKSRQLKKYSMMHVLEILNTTFVAVTAEDLPAFHNYNHPEEI